MHAWFDTQLDQKILEGLLKAELATQFCIGFLTVTDFSHETFKKFPYQTLLGTT